ncbi:hypothetical protein PR202_gb03361 [Eleusine coracana subsp. coracana]|uniref:Uncharacterized protein n=1 Tax=Eleusine coracana subsp. coracana TaxID=191504 RepID=A0AAV5DZA4_ELECO|nr:hypothetical protein PR202_gb03361 [Eleusine coracana subsp. coracana]
MTATGRSRGSWMTSGTWLARMRRARVQGRETGGCRFFRMPGGGMRPDLAPSEVVQFEEDEILVMGFDRELPIGEGVLKMNFTGTLNDQMRGFYRSCLFLPEVRMTG